jgi:hypothetical protein
MWVHGLWNIPKNGKMVEKRPNIEFSKKTQTKIYTHTPSPYIFSLNQNNLNTKHVVERASIFFFFWGKGDCGWVARIFFLPFPLGDY